MLPFGLKIVRNVYKHNLMAYKLKATRATKKANSTAAIRLFRRSAKANALAFPADRRWSQPLNF